MKRSASCLLLIVMLFGLIISASAETILPGEITTEPMSLTIESVMSLYDGEDADALCDFLSDCLPEYEANGSAQQFLAMIMHKLRTEEVFDIIDIMNVRQVMAGFPEGPLPNRNEETEENTAATMSAEGEVRAKFGGIHPRIAVGQAHTVYLTHNGIVYTWGNYYSGDKYIAVNDSGILVELTSLTNIVNVAAGGGSALALRNDGTVWGWGDNTYGQLGNGTTTDSITPVQVKTTNGNLTNVTAIAMGDTSAVAITADGAIYAWGDNTYGQLGNGTTTQSSVAVRVAGENNEGYLSKVKSVSVGGNHVLALKYDGSLCAWGDNTYGQLGDGTNINRSYPVIVMLNGEAISSISSVSAGGKHSLALTNRGKVYAWGANNKGQLGIGSTSASTIPMPVLGINNEAELTFVTDIAAGYEFSAARRSNGHVAAWGDNIMSQLGDRTTQNKAVPTETTNIEMAVHLYAGADFLVAEKANGQVWGVGANNKYQMGDPYPSTKTKKWVMLFTPYARVVDIADSSVTATAVASDGTVYTCGSNTLGQLGNGTTKKDSRPVAVLGPDGTGKLNDVIKAKQGYAIKGDGSLWYWGASYYTGDTETYITLPTQASEASGVIAENLKDFSAGFVKGDANIWQWNDASRVLQPTNTYAEEEIVDGAVQIDGDLMLRYDGTVWTRGSNTYGRLGINESDTSYVAEDWVQVKGLNGSGYLTNIIQIASGMANLALASDGTVYAWGSNYYGNCGNGGTADSHVPVRVRNTQNKSYLTDVTQIKNFDSHCYAFLMDGTIVGWGNNWDGQMGSGYYQEQYNYPRALFSGGRYTTDDYPSSYATAMEISENRWIYGRSENRDSDYFTFIHRGGENVTVSASRMNGSTVEPTASIVYYDAETNSYKSAPRSNGVYTLTVGNRYYMVAHARSVGLMYRFRINAEIDETIDDSADEFDDGSGDDFGDGTGSITGNDFDDVDYGSATISKNFNYSQNVTTTNGTEYTFVLTANDAAGMPQSMTVEYDSAYFDVVTLCALVSEPVTTTGTVDGTGITITAASAGTVTFRRNITVTEGKAWDGAVNVIRLKAKKSGTTVVSCETGGQ